MPRHIRSAWLKTLATLAALLIAAGLLGLAVGHVWMCIALASIGALAWHYWRLRRVLRGLTARHRCGDPGARMTCPPGRRAA